MLLLLLYSCGMVAQKMQSALLIDKQSRQHGLNLKGSVKTLRFFYTYFKEDLPEYEKSHFYLKNDIRTKFYYEFDKLGNITSEKLFLEDSITENVDDNQLIEYEYSVRDYNDKSQLMVKRNQILPSFSNDFVRLNYKKLLKSSYDHSIDRSFLYIFKDGKIIQLKEVYSDMTDSLEDLYAVYSYNYNNNNITSVNVSPGELGSSIGNFTFMDTETPFCGDTRLDYSYDSQNRLTKVILTSCGNVVESEEYTYHKTKGYITTLKRFILNPTYSSYPVNNMVATYNEHGDITEMHFILEGDSNPSRTRIGLDAVHRYYEYEYDKHNNWIKCKLYLLGTKDQPTAIAERRIEYYNQQK